MMESDLLNEQINALASEYATAFKNLNSSSASNVDTSTLESEVEALKSELGRAEEDLKWATNLIENAQKDMEERNMGAIPNDPFFENNNKAKEECERKVNELKSKIEEKENSIADVKKENSNEAELEKLNAIGDKLRKMVEFQKKNVTDSLSAIEKVKSEMIEKAENGIDPTDREIAKMFIKDNNKKIRELKAKIETYDNILESLNNLEASLTNKNEISADKVKEYYEFFNNYNKEPIGNEDIEVNVTFNQETGKYTVSCKSGNFELKPGKEFTKEELTEENINRLLKGFAGAIANNKVLVNANGKRYAGARVNNAAESILTAANSLETTKDLSENTPEPVEKNDTELNNDEPKKDDSKKEEQTKDNTTKIEQNSTESKKNEQKGPDMDPVVHRVISSRNRKRKIGWISDGVAAGVGVVTALAAGPLLGVTAGAVGIVGTEAIVNGAIAFKTAKIRRTLKKIAKENGLKVVTDHETASVYFCGEKGLDSRITADDLNGPKEVSEVARRLQDALDKAFNNDVRGTATKEQREIFMKHKKAASIPLSMCEKVTLDNIEAAYQNVGGVYKRENGFKLKDAIKIATDFGKSLMPEKNTEVKEATIEDALEEEKEEPHETVDAPTVEEPHETKDETVAEDIPVIDDIPVVDQPTETSEPTVEEPVVEEPTVEENQVNNDIMVNADDLLRELGENITVADDLLNEESKGMRM